jgi:hypothetical protein
MRKALALAGTVALTGVAVAAGVPGGGPAAAATGLQAFGTCAGFLSYVKRHASRLVEPWGLPGVGGVVRLDTPASGAVGQDASASPALDYSTTNVQEAGVDEPDVVKTDGSRLFAVAGSTLYAVDASGAEPRLAGSVPLEASWDAQLLLHGDRLLVLSGGGGIIPLRGAAERLIAPFPVETVLTEIDVSDVAAMRITRTLTVEGALVAARAHGSTARIVVASSPVLPRLAGPVEPGPSAEKDARSHNLAVIAASGLRNWVPRYRLADRDRGTETVRRAVACRDIKRPRRFSGLGMLTVLTLDLDRGLEPVDSDAIFAGGEIAYASATGLYVATQRWIDWAGIEAADLLPPVVTTEIHAFDVSRPASTDYRASGRVQGYLLSQWSLSEHEGFLRVASTEEPVWWAGGAGRESESRVTVLEQRGGVLERVGEVTGLGRGERIYAVRFLGDVGYVVTFRQIDPLYVVDLADPSQPAVVGELELLGYSAYLHPIGDGLLLGVGQDATPEGRTLGTQVSVFDVSDPGQPTLVDRRPLAPGWSEAEYDHHAFLWWPASELVVVPVQAAIWDEATGEVRDLGGAVGLRAGAGGLSEVGRVTHPAGQIRRSVVVGDTLYTISEAGVLASELATLAERAWVPFA